MLYDLHNALQIENFKIRVEKFLQKKAVVELTEKKERRSLAANAYLHVILSYFAAVTGNTMSYVKLNYYKLHCNRDIFVVEQDDKLIGKKHIIRSSSTLTSDEMSLSIERFRNFASVEAGIYIPSGEESLALQQCRIEIERNKEFI
jgi:hypothetical protein